MKTVILLVSLFVILPIIFLACKKNEDVVLSDITPFYIDKPSQNLIGKWKFIQKASATVDASSIPPYIKPPKSVTWVNVDDKDSYVYNFSNIGTLEVVYPDRTENGFYSVSDRDSTIIFGKEPNGTGYHFGGSFFFTEKDILIYRFGDNYDVNIHPTYYKYTFNRYKRVN